jgi:hypothetical protein
MPEFKKDEIIAALQQAELEMGYPEYELDSPQDATSAVNIDEEDLSEPAANESSLVQKLPSEQVTGAPVRTDELNNESTPKDHIAVFPNQPGSTQLQTSSPTDAEEVRLNLLRQAEWTVDFMHVTARHGHSDDLEQFIKRGCGVDPVDADGNTPLFEAARFGHLAAVEVLLRAGADPSHRNAQAQQAQDVVVDPANADAIRAALRKAVEDRQPLATVDVYVYPDQVPENQPGGRLVKATAMPSLTTLETSLVSRDFLRRSDFIDLVRPMANAITVVMPNGHETMLWEVAKLSWTSALSYKVYQHDFLVVDDAIPADLVISSSCFAQDESFLAGSRPYGPHYTKIRIVDTLTTSRNNFAGEPLPEQPSYASGTEDLVGRLGEPVESHQDGNDSRPTTLALQNNKDDISAGAIPRRFGTYQCSYKLLTERGVFSYEGSARVPAAWTDIAISYANDHSIHIRRTHGNSTIFPDAQLSLDVLLKAQFEDRRKIRILELGEGQLYASVESLLRLIFRKFYADSDEDSLEKLLIDSDPFIPAHGVEGGPLSPSAAASGSGSGSKHEDLPVPDPVDDSEQGPKLFYSSAFDADELVKQMRKPPPVGLPLMNPRWHLKLHYNCFCGYEMVDWLLRIFQDIDTREEATVFGNELLRRRIIAHITDKHDFRDGNYFYQIVVNCRQGEGVGGQSDEASLCLSATPHLETTPIGESQPDHEDQYEQDETTSVVDGPEGVRAANTSAGNADRRDASDYVSPKATLRIYCDNCERTVSHWHTPWWHCNLCLDGDYDICQGCVDQNIFCRSDEHWLVKRSISDGQFRDDTTHRIPPRRSLQTIHEDTVRRTDDGSGEPSGPGMKAHPGEGHGSERAVTQQPGSNVQTYNLPTDRITPRNQLKKPVQDILRDVNRRFKANVELKEGPRAHVTLVSTGPTNDVQDALREAVRQVCGNQSDKVLIPAFLRSRIIGKHGTTIQAISKRTGARIHIPKQEPAILEDDDLDTTVGVIVEGDLFGVEEAKREIENIVHRSPRTTYENDSEGIERLAKEDPAIALGPETSPDLSRPREHAVEDILQPQRSEDLDTGSSCSYYFTIEALATHPNALPRFAVDGRWLPSKRADINSKGPARLFYYNGSSTAMITALPKDVLNFGCYSMYYDHGRFHTVAFDASVYDVGNGADYNATAGGGRSSNDEGAEDNDDNGEDNEDSQDEQNSEDWLPLTFAASLTGHMSYAGRHLPSQRLLYMRHDQIWPNQLLPDGYLVANRSHQSQYGGLVGDLPLLLALMAFSMPQQYVEAAGHLAPLIRSPWIAPPPVLKDGKPYLYRGIGCKLHTPSRTQKFPVGGRLRSI